MKTFSVIRPTLAAKRLNTACCTSLLLAALSLHVQAEVYKWVDADGSIHYSDIKPNDKNATRIKTQTGQSINASDADSEPNESDVSSNNPQARAQALDEQMKTQQDVVDRQAEMDKAKAEQDEKCATIRENLKKMEENSRIRIDDNGQVRYLSAEEIIEKKKNFQKMLDESCN